MKLQEILTNKRRELDELMRRAPLAALEARLGDAPPVRSLQAALAQPGVSLIAEVKKASPSKGLIRADFEPVAIARAYAAAGARAISVLTDERFFMGKLEYLTQVRAAVAVPVLRKDFVVEPYQLYEARAAGADACLLIVACLEPDELGRLLGVARALGLEALVEVHTAAELEIALRYDAPIIGINNRDLATFVTDLAVTRSLRAKVPQGRLVVAESGIFTRADIDSLGDVDAVLVGESLMRQADVGAAVRALLAPTASGGPS